jgi:hypothetical protein
MPHNVSRYFDALQQNSERRLAQWYFVGLGYNESLSDYIEVITQTSANEPATINATKELVTIALDKNVYIYGFPEVLQNLDLEGWLAPVELARRIEEATTFEEISELSKFGGAYVLGSNAWKTLATPVMLFKEQPNLPERRGSISS